jgi:protein-tyrosine phosphatase
MNELFGDLRQLDIHPILTHPERNAMLLHNVKVLANYVKNGMYCQVTAMSITGEFGKSAQNFTKKLFKKGLVHVVATDAHDSKKRPPVLSAAYEKIKREFSDDTARRVFITNPLKIVRGEEIE